MGVDRASELESLVKAYDIRGLAPQQLDPTITRAIGAAFVDVVDATGGVVVGRDMRDSGVELAAAFSDGVRDRGIDVIDIGQCSTDGLYFASGFLDRPGVMFTASHNPASYNGIKLCHAQAAPIGTDTGLLDIRDRAATFLRNGLPAPAPTRGASEHRDLLDAYATHLRSLVDLTGLRRLHVVVDAGNGMAGLTTPAVLGRLDLELDPMYFELDGTFPNHEANPIEPANLLDLQDRVRTVGADLGLAFDGDADRCFVVDENGDPVNPSTLTALVAVRELERVPGSTIIHNLITSKAVPEIVREHGGTPVRTRVGHSYIKAEMARTGAVFGGEHSGHFYFRDFWRADSGMLAALHVLAALGSQPAGTLLSELLMPYHRYASSGEQNTKVDDAASTLASIRRHYTDQSDVTLDDLDGLTVSAPRWWFNVRPSNTEPLLRLNVEGDDEATMVGVRDEVLALIGGSS